MVLENYVILQTGIPATMHFYDHVIERRDITDTTTGAPTSRNALIFEVDELNGRKVTSKLSTLSEKLAGEFEPYLGDKSYRNYDVVITKQGTGFRTRYSVAFLPRK